MDTVRHAQPARPGSVLPALWTASGAASFALAKGFQRNRGPRALLIAFVVLAVLAGVALGWPAAVLVVVAMPVAGFAVFVVWLLLLLGAAMLPFTRRGVRAWVNTDATLFVTAVRTGPQRWQATNLCARHPGAGERANGEHRSDPFIADIVAQADELGITINATAGDMKLYDDIYRNHGFTIRKPGQRPKITRPPTQG